MVDELLPADREVAALREEVRKLASEITRLVRRVEQLEKLRSKFEIVLERELQNFKHRLLSSLSHMEEHHDD